MYFWVISRERSEILRNFRTIGVSFGLKVANNFAYGRDTFRHSVIGSDIRGLRDVLTLLSILGSPSSVVEKINIDFQMRYYLISHLDGFTFSWNHFILYLDNSMHIYRKFFPDIRKEIRIWDM